MAKRREAGLTARTADKYALYADAVQSPPADVEFFRRLYERVNGRLPVVLREDFCGTAAVCCQWVYTDAHNRAIGVDLDPEPLRWARRNYLRLLGSQRARRIELRCADVLRVRPPRADVIAALNFSFCVFKQRDVLVRYLTRCRQGLKRGGIMVMDIYGGPAAQIPHQTRTRKKGYTYVWEKARYKPASAEVLNHIHFEFPDGSRLMKAFIYDWRLWTLPELTEALGESGFRDVGVYWEDDGRQGGRTGVYRRRTRVSAPKAWVAYVVGLR